MQDRIKEIRDRADLVYSYYRKYSAEDQLIQQDIPYLLAALQEAQEINECLSGSLITSHDKIIELDKALQQYQGRERALEEKNNFFKDWYKKRLEIEEEIAEMLGMEVDCGILERIAIEVKNMQYRERVLQEENKRLLDERQSVDGYRNQLIKILQKNTKLADRERILREALKELVSIVQGVIDGDDYKFDSFTLQPANKALGMEIWIRTVG